jgi:hypothetical protein
MTKGRVSGGDVGVSAAEESEGRDDDEDQGRDEGDDDYLRQTPAQQMRIFQLEKRKTIAAFAIQSLRL